jgi:hypothetical protein
MMATERTAPLLHETPWGGTCDDCITVERNAQVFSICWACAHVIDHATGHVCAVQQ